MKYHFSGFSYDTEQKTLKLGSQSKELTREYHSLLSYLLSRPQQLISLKEMKDQVWPNQAVTHYTIEQSILKFSQTLNKYHQDHYIETVSEQGIRFIPKVSSLDLNTNHHKFKLEWLILILTVGFLLLYLLFKTKTTESNVLSNSEAVNFETNKQTELTNATSQKSVLKHQMQTKIATAKELYQKNEFTKAEQLIKESLIYNEQQNNQQGIIDNRTKLAKIYQQTGRFSLAEQNWRMILAMHSEQKNATNSAEAILWLLQLHLIKNNTTQAKNNLKSLAQLFKKHPTQAITSLFYEGQLMIALYQQDLSNSQQHLTSLINSDHQLIKMYRGDVARLEAKHTAAEMYYLEALLHANTNGDFNQITLILNRLNALYININSKKLTENLRRTSKLKPFIYPLQKYQAQAAKLSGNNNKALSLMEDLKLKAGDYWQNTDQLLLESLQN